MDRKHFNLKLRIPKSDWEILTKVVEKDSAYYETNEYREWFVKQINEFCEDYAIPLIGVYNNNTTLVQRQVLVQSQDMLNSTNLEILQAFANLKHSTITQIIFKYIVDPKILKDETLMLKRMVK